MIPNYLDINNPQPSIQCINDTAAMGFANKHGRLRATSAV